MRFRVRSNIEQRITQVKANLQALPEQIGDIAQEVIDRSEPVIIDTLTFTPPTPRRKIEWTSDRQRKAYFATNGFGKGIPYKRRGATTKGWRLFGIRTPNGATIIVRNEWSAAKYVYGGFTQIKPQQRFHEITGWPQAKNQRAEIYRVLVSSVRDVIRNKGIQL